MKKYLLIPVDRQDCFDENLKMNFKKNLGFALLTLYVKLMNE